MMRRITIADGIRSEAFSACRYRHLSAECGRFISDGMGKPRRGDLFIAAERTKPSVFEPRRGGLSWVAQRPNYPRGAQFRSSLRGLRTNVLGVACYKQDTPDGVSARYESFVKAAVGPKPS